jgi:hypothetical protein
MKTELKNYKVSEIVEGKRDKNVILLRGIKNIFQNILTQRHEGQKSML